MKLIKSVKLLMILISVSVLMVPFNSIFTAKDVKISPSEGVDLEDNQEIRSDENIKLLISSEEVEQIKSLDPKLLNDPLVYKLNEEGLLSEFTNRIEEENRLYVLENQEEKNQLLKEWNIDEKITVVELKELAQVCLDYYGYNVEIDSNDFSELVAINFSGDSSEILKISKNDKEMAPLYIYMCIYYNDKMLNNLPSNKGKVLAENVYATLEEIIDVDINQDFIETGIYQLMYEVLADSEAKAGPDQPLNGDVIQAYARRWALENNPYFISLDQDCTNYVSQALFNSLLPMYFYSSDKTANGVVDTGNTGRWFYFNNSSPSKYSVSTSWIRVGELFDFLKPRYAVFETTDGSIMTRYLNKGFVLQGKHFLGSYSHSVIVTKTTTGTYCDAYCAHTNFRKDEPLQTFYDGYYKYRCVQVY